MVPLRGLGLAALAIGIYLVIWSPRLHRVAGGGHYLIHAGYAGAWSVLVGLVCWVGAAWLRGRKTDRPWSAWEVAAAYAAGLLFAALSLGFVVWLFGPRLIA